MSPAVEELLLQLLSALPRNQIATKDTPLLSTAEVGLIIGRHPKTVLELVAEEKIGCIRQDPHAGVQFAQKHVDEYLASCEVPAQKAANAEVIILAEHKPDRNPKYANR